MLLHLVKDSLVRRRRRVAVAIISLLVGTALVSGLLAVSLDIEDKVGKELRSYGANIMLTPKSDATPVEIGGIPVGEVGQKSYFSDEDLPKLKSIFWKNNITAFVPYLYGQANLGDEAVSLAGTWFDQELTLEKGGSFRTGAKETSPWWQVEGGWPANEGQALVGRELAERQGLEVGSTLQLSREQAQLQATVAGIVTTGGAEENQIFLNLEEAQQLLSLPDKVEKVQVSALTKPPDELARRAQTLGDPKELPPSDYEKWYCSPYIDSITYQIEEVFPGGQAKQLRQVASAEGAFLGKMKLLFLLIAGVAMTTSALGVTATMSATVMERREEIGLMKALGAENKHIAGQFFLEAAVTALVGGALGYALGMGLAALIGREVFGAVAPPSVAVLPLALLIALAIALVGSALPVRKAVRIHPIQALKG